MQLEAIFRMIVSLRGRLRSTRQEDVLAMIEDGLSRAEIAEYLGITIGRVKYTASKSDNPRASVDKC